ncbi:autotransporter outer membrane beta-barrel domain-containing protein [Termitidicoccus mucosus]|uniref:Autotransporter domain-containing protein n=1 Tax=Termitidicoccus mucosus TaxID=1184151 RepID=A0A178IL41_9BACT|nr:hypothetical protein AW736_07370 [Opitutaceae bacterium TSB47]
MKNSSPSQRKLSRLLPLLLCLAPHLEGANREWAATGTGDFADMGNWKDAAPPAAGDTVLINNGGTAVINGASITISRLEAGGTGKDAYGALNIINGGTLTIATYAMIGYNSGNASQWGSAGLGAVTVSGTGSVLKTTSNSIFVGRGNKAVLNIINGGTAISAGEFAIGESASGVLPDGGSGTVNITGAGSNLTATTANIGKNRAGTMFISDGGSANFTGDVTIGNAANSVGELHVNAGGLFSIANNKGLFVGGNTSGAGVLGSRSGLLAGTGTLNLGTGIVTVSRNGTLSAGDNPGEIGTLFIIGSLNLGTVADGGNEKSARLNIDHNSATADLINLSGAVTFGSIIKLDLSSLASIAAVPIITAGANLPALPADIRFTINGAAFSTLDRLAGALPSASLSVSGSQLLMTVASTAANKHLVWTGAVGNTWNLTGTNWREVGGGSLAFLTGDSVTFSTLGGVTSATITADIGQTVSQLALVGDTSYTLAGNFSADGSLGNTLLTGTSGKLLLGASGTAFNGTLTLTGNNNFLGGVELHSGTLSVATVRNLGASLSSVTFAGTDASASTLLITDDITFDFYSNASGDPVGSDNLLINPGVNATVQMAAGKSLTFAQNSGGMFGPAIVNQGNLAIRTDGGTVTFDSLNASTPTAYGGAVANPGTLSIDDALFISNTVGGRGGAIYNSGNLTLHTTHTAAHTGNAALGEGSTAAASAGGFLYMGNNSTATLDITGRLTIGDASSLANQTDSIASLNADATLTKTGTGTLVLNADNTHYTGAFNLVAGTVQVNGASALFGGAINGAGNLVLNNTGDNLAFASGDFHGTLRLQGTAGGGASYHLDTVAGMAPTRSILAASHLQLATGGTLSIGSGSYALRGLDFAGGDFHTTRDGFAFSGTLRVGGTLALSDPVSSKIIFDDFNPGDSMGSLYTGGGGSVFSLDEAGANAVLLIAADTLAAGHAGRTVKLYANDGATAIATSQTIALDANAVGTFENMAVAITGSAGAGLYMDSLLQKIEILLGKTFTLASDSATDNALLNTTITGAGNLSIAATGTHITLGAANSYTGETRVTTGTLRLTAAGALGDTSDLVIQSGAGVLLDGDTVYGNTQSIGAYTGTAGARLSLGTGTLAVTAAKGTGLFNDNGATTDLGAAGHLILNGGHITGVLTADAANAALLDIATGTTTIGSANTALNITATIAAGATLRLTDGGALGTGAIAFDGTLELAATGANTHFHNTFAGVTGTAAVGHGTILKTGSGAMTIASSNPDLNVPVVIEQGRLVAGAFDALGVSVITTQAGGVMEFSGVEGTLTNTIAGDGTLAFTNGARVTIDSEYAIPSIEISSAAAVTAGHLLALGGTTSKISVTGGASLIIDTYDNATRNFDLGELHLSGGGALRFTPAGTTFRKAIVNRLTGSGGVLAFNVDFKTVRDQATAALSPVIPVGRAANHVTVTTAGTGTHGVFVINANPAFTAPLDGSFTPLIDTASGDATRFQLVDAAGAPIPYYESGLVALKLVKGGEDESTYTDNPDRWYLADSGLASVADAIIGTAAMAGKDWHYSVDALYLRMGDVRAGLAESDSGRTGNVWARGRGYRLKANYKLLGRPFDETLYGVTAGADCTFRPHEEVTLLAGVFFDGGRVTRDFVNYGSGESSTFGAGVYGSILFESGWHGDLVLKSDRSKNSFDARTVDGRVTNGDYNSNAEGFSAELGRRFQLKHDWWFESSVQLATAWLNGVDYEALTSESPIPVRVDGSRSTQYRGGLRVGRDLGRLNPYAKIAWAKTDTSGGVIHAHTRAFDPGMNGWRFETGAGVSIRLSDRSALYLDYEYATADAYQRPWSFNLGYRTLW